MTVKSRMRRFGPAIAGFLCSALAVGLGISAGVANIQRAQSRGDVATANTLVLTALVVGSLTVLMIVAFVVWLPFRRRLIDRRLRSAVEAFPDGLVFMVAQPRVVGATREVRGRLRRVRAMVVRNRTVTAVSFAGSVPSALEVFREPVTVARRERMASGIALPEFQFAHSGERGTVVLGVLPENVRRRAVPPFPSLDALVAELQRRLD